MMLNSSHFYDRWALLDWDTRRRVRPFCTSKYSKELEEWLTSSKGLLVLRVSFSRLFGRKIWPRVSSNCRSISRLSHFVRLRCPIYYLTAKMASNRSKCTFLTPWLGCKRNFDDDERIDSPVGQRVLLGSWCASREAQDTVRRDFRPYFCANESRNSHFENQKTFCTRPPLFKRLWSIWCPIKWS